MNNIKRVQAVLSHLIPTAAGVFKRAGRKYKIYHLFFFRSYYLVGNCIRESSY